MQDIRHYSDNELCLLFDNTEFLYNEFQSALEIEDFEPVQEIAGEYYVYTDKQLETLENSFYEELE